MNNWYPRVTEYLQNHRDEIVADLMDLCRIPSISQDGKDGLPFGKDVDDVLVAAAALFEKHGFPAEVKHASGYAISVLEGQGQGIGLFGHADVVPVNDDWVKTTPFSPVEEDGILYARGISDNKAGVIASLYALCVLKAAGITPKSRISVFIGGSEETGMKDIRAFAAQEVMPAVSLVPDSGFPVSIGEKGIMRVDCRSIAPLQDVVKLDGGQAYNVVLDHVDVALKNGQQLSFDGLTAHAASPAGSVNAAVKAAKALCAMDICQQDKEILAGLQEILNNDYGETLHIASTGAFGQLTCANGITRVESDGHLVFTLDIRYGSEVGSVEAAKVLSQQLAHFGFTATIIRDDPGFLLDESGEPLKIVLDACRRIGGVPEAQPFKMGGGTYARYLKNAYALSHSIPTGKKPADLPAGHGGAHQSDEYLVVDGLLGGIAVIASIIAQLDGWLCGTQE